MISWNIKDNFNINRNCSIKFNKIIKSYKQKNKLINLWIDSKLQIIYKNTIVVNIWSINKKRISQEKILNFWKYKKEY